MSKTFNRFSKLLCQRLGMCCLLPLLLTFVVNKEQPYTQAARKRASEALIQRFAAHPVEMSSSKSLLLLSVRVHPSSLVQQHVEQYSETANWIWTWIAELLLDDSDEYYDTYTAIRPLPRPSDEEWIVWSLQAVIATLSMLFMTSWLLDRLDSINKQR